MLCLHSYSPFMTVTAVEAEHSEPHSPCVTHVSWLYDLSLPGTSPPLFPSSLHVPSRQAACCQLPAQQHTHGQRCRESESALTDSHAGKDTTHPVYAWRTRDARSEQGVSKRGTKGIRACNTGCQTPPSIFPCTDVCMFASTHSKQNKMTYIYISTKSKHAHTPKHTHIPRYTDTRTHALTERNKFNRVRHALLQSPLMSHNNSL